MREVPQNALQVLFTHVISESKRRDKLAENEETLLLLHWGHFRLLLLRLPVDVRVKAVM